MNRIVLSSDELPAQLDDRAKFARWHETFEALTCCTDYFRLEDQPFSAHFEWLQLGGAHVTRFGGTLSRVARSRSAIARGPDDDFCILLNRGTSAFMFSQLGHETTVAPGAGVLATNGAAAEMMADARCQFGTVTINRDRLRKLVAGIDDLVARPLDGREPVVRHLRRYVESVLELGDTGDKALERHISTTLLDLVALALGTQHDIAEVARLRGLRAARLQEILAEIKRNFADPGFSPARVSQKLGLSARYIQDLLQESGATFSERVLELRLQEARRLLTTRQHKILKIGEIAYASGFSEISYFNQCFRRRFGTSPTQLRGAEGPTDAKES